MGIEEIRRVKEKLYLIAAKNGIKKVYVFGSVVRAQSSETSDIDFVKKCAD